MTRSVLAVAALLCFVCVAANDPSQQNGDTALSRVFRYFGLGKQAEQGGGSVPYPPKYGPCPLQPSTTTTTTTTTSSPLVPLCPYPFNAEALPLVGGEGQPLIAPPLFQGPQILPQPGGNHGGRPPNVAFIPNPGDINQIYGNPSVGFNPDQVRPGFNPQSGNRPEQVRPGFNFPNGNRPDKFNPNLGNFPPNLVHGPNSEKNPIFFKPNPNVGFMPKPFNPNEGNSIFNPDNLPLPVEQQPSPPKNFFNDNNGQGGFRPNQGFADFNGPRPFIPGLIQNPNTFPLQVGSSEQLTPVQLKPEVFKPTEIERPNANIPILVESIAHDFGPETPYVAKPEATEHVESPVQVKPIAPEKPESPLLIKPDILNEKPEKPLEVIPISPETPLNIKPESPLPELPVAIKPHIDSAFSVRPQIPTQNLEKDKLPNFGENRPNAIVPHPVGPNYNFGSQSPFAPNQDSNLPNFIPVDGRPTFGPDGKPIFGEFQGPLFGPDGRPIFGQPQGPGFVPFGPNGIPLGPNAIPIGPDGIPFGPNNLIPVGASNLIPVVPNNVLPLGPNPNQQPNGKFPIAPFPPRPNEMNLIDATKPLDSYKCIPSPGPFVPPGFSLVSYPQGICSQASPAEAPCSMLETLQKLRLRTFSTLIRLAGLEQLFVDKPNYTLFVPVDVAFELLPRYFLEDLVANKTLLNEFIYSHIAVAEVTLPTLGTETLLRNRRRGTNRLRVTVAFPDLDYPSYLVNDAKILKGDILTTNGRLNIIDKVLKPYPAITAYKYLSEIEDLKEFFNKVEIAGMVDVLKSPDPVTIFVPYNKAFASMNFDEMDKRAIQNFVKYHMVNGSHYSSALQNNQYLTTNYLKEIKASVANDGFTKYLSLLNGNIRILKADITTTNAVIHIIEQCIAEDAPQYIFEDSSEFRFEFGTLRRSMKLSNQEITEEKSSTA